MPREIALTKGYVALVDDADFEWLSRWKWFFVPKRARTGGGYACRSQRIDKKMRTVLMHRVILEAPSGVKVDHRSGDGLDNRRTNIRLCTSSQNSANMDGWSVHGFKGIYQSYGSRFRAEVRVHGVRQYLGCFATAAEAAQAYDAAALHHFGEFARLNFPVAA